MIRAMSLDELGAGLGVTAVRGATLVSGVSTDTRTLAAGDLFVALRGERFDGHDHIDAALAQGAAAIVSARALPASVPHLQVTDTQQALGAIARLHRALFDGRVIALTGSAGKTTTKEMIAAMLRGAGTVLATRGNLNNEIGVPRTLLDIAPGTRYAVIEMGASRPGDIRYLAAIARPDVALVTNAMPAHLQGFGSVANVASTKGEIYAALPADGIAVLNADDAFAPSWRALIGARCCLAFSAAGADADVQAHDVVIEDGLARFTLQLPGAARAVTLRIPGVQQVANALAAATVAHALGLGLDAIVAGLDGLQLPGGRMDRRATTAGCVLIDDSYNANPGSVRAAIDTLASCGGTRVLVLGNMAELGADAARLHAEVGAHARVRGIDAVLAMGEHAAELVAACGDRARAFTGIDALAAACRAFDRPGVTLLVKGSRSAGMERIVAALLPAAGATAGLPRTEIH